MLYIFGKFNELIVLFQTSTNVHKQTSVTLKQHVIIHKDHTYVLATLATQAMERIAQVSIESHGIMSK
jgi:hypothetical protein